MHRPGSTLCPSLIKECLDFAGVEFSTARNQRSGIEKIGQLIQVERVLARVGENVQIRSAKMPQLGTGLINQNPADRSWVATKGKPASRHPANIPITIAFVVKWQA